MVALNCDTCTLQSCQLAMASLVPNVGNSLSSRARKTLGSTKLCGSWAGPFPHPHAHQSSTPNSVQDPPFRWPNLILSGLDEHCWPYPDKSLRPSRTTKVHRHTVGGGRLWCTLRLLLLYGLQAALAPNLNLYQSGNQYLPCLMTN